MHALPDKQDGRHLSLPQDITGFFEKEGTWLCQQVTRILPSPEGGEKGLRREESGVKNKKRGAPKEKCLALLKRSGAGERSRRDLSKKKLKKREETERQVRHAGIPPARGAA